MAHAAVSGGMITVFGRYVAKQLVEQGAEMHFFASRYLVFGCLPPVAEFESIGGRFHGLPLLEHLSPLKDIWSLVLMIVALRRLRVQVLNTRGSVMGAIGRIAGKLAGVPVIIHHQDDLYCRDERLSPRARRLVAFIEKNLSLLADRSLFISEAVLEKAIAIGFPKERCVLIGIGLNDVFQAAAREAEQRKEPVLGYLGALGVPDNARIVGCIGRFTQHKGIDLFLEAAKQLAPDFPEWAFVIKGEGPLRDALRSTIQEYKLSKRVFLLTKELPLADVPALYRCFDLFALPTRREGFGMVFAEAMAMGIPVVAPRIAPITDVVTEKCGVLVEPENVNALVGALRELMADGSMRTQIAARGRERACTMFCGKRAENRTLEVYRELLRQKRLLADSAIRPGI